jgi:hypothetical protein
MIRGLGVETTLRHLSEVRGAAAGETGFEAPLFGTRKPR